MRTLMHTDAQRLLDHRSAPATTLRRAAWINLDIRPTSICRGSTETSASSVEPLAKVLTPAQYRVIEALLVGRTGKDAVEKAT